MRERNKMSEIVAPPFKLTVRAIFSVETFCLGRSRAVCGSQWVCDAGKKRLRRFPCKSSGYQPLITYNCARNQRLKVRTQKVPSTRLITFWSKLQENLESMSLSVVMGHDWGKSCSSTSSILTQKCGRSKRSLKTRRYTLNVDETILWIEKKDNYSLAEVQWSPKTYQSSS